MKGSKSFMVLICLAVASSSPLRAGAPAAKGILPMSFPTQTLTISASAPVGRLAYPLLKRNADFKKVTYEVGTCETHPGAGAAILPKTFPLPSPGDDTPRSSAFSPDGRMLCLGFEYTFLVWDTVTHKSRKGPRIRGYPRFLWAPDSRHIAYFQGGDENGEEMFGTEPLTLLTYDVKTGVSRRIAQGPLIKMMAWTLQGSLLYTDASTKEDGSTSVYEAATAGGETVELIPNAAAPSPSPDGQWIAFIGSNDERTTNGSPLYGIYLFHRRDKRRRLVRFLPKNTDPQEETVVWTSDSRSFVLAEHRYRTTRTTWTTQNASQVFPGFGKMTITQFWLAPWRHRQVGQMGIADEDSRLADWTQVEVDGLSASNQRLYVKTNALKNKMFFYEYRAVDLVTGRIVPIFSGPGVNMVCWQEGLAPKSRAGTAGHPRPPDRPLRLPDLPPPHR